LNISKIAFYLLIALVGKVIYVHLAKDVSKPTKVIMSLASGSDRRDP
jgi:hypothetical protein